jgi:hypothetical protein
MARESGMRLRRRFQSVRSGWPESLRGRDGVAFDDLVTEPEGEPGLRRAHSLDLTQHEHEAIRFGKAVDGLFEHSMELTRVGLVFRAGIAAGQGCQRSG